ncbi:MAG: class D sortase [Ruminococcus sp.]|uniref:class D sortase n=1 Tax=Ruminococcus sp. TaxID=41978 RepID=UPI0025E79543|nr:class D sortase [Ruminococcus sp.]MBR5683655.1 class D sortase [Ruminococcus sp.]
MNNKQAKDGALIHVVTPFILLFICVGVLIAAMIKPADKLKVYLNIAFMDNLKNTPESAGSGLVIRDNDIIDGYSGETFEEGEFIRPKFGEMYAVLTTSAFDISIPVYWGSSSELYERGACQSSSSAIIGDKGNSVISAHQDTYFADLNKLKKDDTIALKTNYGEFEYKVTDIIIFNKKENKYVSPSETSKLTLYTCKKDVLGNSDERLGVICEPTVKKFYKKAEESKK